MDFSQSKNLPQAEPLPRVAEFFKSSEKVPAIVKSLAYLSLCYPSKEIQEAAQLSYVEILADLEPEQLAIAFSQAARECPYFPSPSELRKLAGVKTAAQRGEEEAMAAFSWLLDWLNKHSIEGRPTRGALIREKYRDEASGLWIPDEYEWTQPQKMPDKVHLTLKELGAGMVEEGARLIWEHPILQRRRNPEEYPSLGLKLSAMDKLEARWLDAWKRANS